MPRSNHDFSQLVNKFVRNKIHCYFVSPHLDDAVFSCGDLISYLANKTPVTIINIFTQADDGPYTLSAKAYLKKSGYKEALKIYSERRKEDAKVLSKLKVEVINLGFVDALWRKKEVKNVFYKMITKLVPELGHVYPTYRWHVTNGKVSKKDNRLIESIEKSLAKIIRFNLNYLVLCPAGIGDHVDHVITRKICRKNFENVIYWSDYPYSLKAEIPNFVKNNGFGSFEYSNNLSGKRKMVLGYKSQVTSIFKNGKMKVIPESYFL